MWSLVRDQLLDRLRDSRELQAITPALEAEVRAGTLTPGLAAQQLVAAFLPDAFMPDAFLPDPGGPGDGS
jgi:hypothetical protein